MSVRACSLSLALFLSFALSACGDDDGTELDGGARGVRDAGTADAALDGSTAPAAMTCDVIAPTTCVEPKPGFAEIEPIIKDRCRSCHDGRGTEWPLLDYEHVASWYAQIRDSMIKCTMPPADAGIDMPTEEREALLHWIRCGFPR